ncbi:MAG: hypothetical protein ABR574_12410 [Cryomorphaceae bacterium]
MRDLLFFPGFKALKVFLFSVLYVVAATAGYTQSKQIYGELGAGINFYDVSSLDNLKQGNTLPYLRMGFAAYHSDDLKTDITAEITACYRSYKRRYRSGDSEQTFRYLFFSPELMILVGRRLSDKFYAQAGAGATYFLTRTITPNPFARFSGDFANFDILLAGGLSYEVSDQIAFGLHYRMGLIPMLEYEPIGTYGDIGPEKKDIMYRTVQLALRYYLKKPSL